MTSEFVLFQANNKNFQYNQSVSEEKQVILLLADVRNYCLTTLPAYCPVTNAVAALAPKARSAREIALALQSIKPSQFEAQMQPFVTLKFDPEKIPKHASSIDFGWIAFLNALWTRAYSFPFSSKGFHSKKEIRFASNYQGWLLVKKVNLEIATPQEVLSFLSTSFILADKKLAEYSCNNYSDFETVWENYSAKFSVRKGYAKLCDMLSKAVDLENEVKALAKKPEYADYVVQHFYHKIFEYAGYAPFATIETINGNYPELKIPKPKGNFGKKKKTA